MITMQLGIINVTVYHQNIYILIISAKGFLIPTIYQCNGSLYIAYMDEMLFIYIFRSDNNVVLILL